LIFSVILCILLPELLSRNQFGLILKTIYNKKREESRMQSWQMILLLIYTAASLQVVVVQAMTFGTKWKNSKSFAAEESNGNIVTWGDSNAGGQQPSGLSDVDVIYSNDNAFCAIMSSDKGVLCWGPTLSGGTAPPGLSNVLDIVPECNSFAAIKSDNTVIIWGSSINDINPPSDLNNVVKLYSTGHCLDGSAFLAVKKDMTIVTWGREGYGGNNAPADVNYVVDVFSTAFMFATISSTGAVKAWGSIFNTLNALTNNNPVASGCITMATTWHAFTCIIDDGSIVSFGHGNYGGTTPSGISNVIS
jgi:hypothetical protein